MREVPIVLTLAEQYGLHLLRKRLEAVRTEQAESFAGLKVIQKVRILPDDILRISIAARPVLVVELERISSDNWEARCPCNPGGSCIHCAVAVASLVGEEGRKEGRSGPRPAAAAPRPQPETDLAKTVRSLLKRSLTPTETSYLNQIQTGYDRLHLTHVISRQDMAAVSATPGHAGPQARTRVMDVWPELPRDPLNYWHGLARQARLQETNVPEFMQKVAELAPPPAEWLRAWEQEELKQWVDALAEAAESLSSIAKEAERPAEMVNLRLALTPEALQPEVQTPLKPGWRPLRAQAFLNHIEEYTSGEITSTPEAQVLWDQFARLQMNHYGVYLDWEPQNPVQKLVASLLNRADCRPLIVNKDGAPFEFSPEPLRWAMRPPDSESPTYRFNLVRPDGTVATGLDIWIPGPPGYAGDKRILYQAPPIPSFLNTNGTTQIPAEAVETEAGVRLLKRLGIPLTPDLEKAVHLIPLHLGLEFRLIAPDSGSTVQDRVTIHATTRTPTGEIVDAFRFMTWQTNSGRRSGRKTVNYDRDQVRHPVPLVQGLGGKWDANQDCFTLRITRNFPETFLAWHQSLPATVEVLLPDLLKTILVAPIEAEVRLNVEPQGVDWFDLSVQIEAKDSDLTPEELNLLLGAKGGYVRLGEKGWRRASLKLTEEDTRQLANIGLDPLELSNEPQRLHALQLADEATRRLLPENQAEEIRIRASELKARVTPPVPTELKATLRPYQLDGFHFLAYLAENRFGGVLADDMGLGKTVQTLTWIAWVRRRLAETADASQPDMAGVAGRILIVCPKSVVPNWKAEANRFLPDLRVATWQGQGESEFPAVAAGCDLLVMNYAQLRGLQETLVRQEWLAVVLDEAQAIKNPDSQTAQAARALKATHRLALTGTPIENRLLDLWSILTFAMPGALGKRATFQRAYGRSTDTLARQRLAARVRPFLLRRTKSQVARDLPPRIEEDLVCELEGVQRDLYRAEYKKARTLLLKVRTSADLDQLRFHFLTSLLRLRQICCHPALVDRTHLEAGSAKVEAMLDLLEPLMEEGNKVLVFSQFVSMLDLLQKEVRKREWKDFYLAGDTEDRGDLVEAFNKTEGAAVFLISLKAGGFGLNLTSASYVVLFDPWWNPAVESQAIDRTHRIGQTRTVFAYRLLVKGSIEEKIRELQRQKSALAGDILGEERFSQALTLNDLEFLFSSAEPAL